MKTTTAVNANVAIVAVMIVVLAGIRLREITLTPDVLTKQGSFPVRIDRPTGETEVLYPYNPTGEAGHMTWQWKHEERQFLPEAGRDKMKTRRLSQLTNLLVPLPAVCHRTGHRARGGDVEGAARGHGLLEEADE
jgi:hypothetical protein